MRRACLILAAVALALGGVVAQAESSYEADVKLASRRVQAAEIADAAVVSLRVRRVTKEEPRPRFSRSRKVTVEQISGSGVILREDGLIATNAHVVEGAVMIKAVMADGREAPAAPLLFDRARDLAVLRLKEGRDYPALKLSSRDAIQGEQVVAVGDAFGQGRRRTAGIVLGRMPNDQDPTLIDDVVVSAEVAPGQSGGALVDLEGNLLGVLVARIDRGGGQRPLGVAVPVSMVRQAVEAALAGKVALPPRRAP